MARGGGPLSDTQEDGNWTDLNATLRNLQFYDARAGVLSGHGTAVWGGLQGNGSGFLSTGSNQMAEAAGGDGFDVIVDPRVRDQRRRPDLDGHLG